MKGRFAVRVSLEILRAVRYSSRIFEEDIASLNTFFSPTLLLIKKVRSHQLERVFWAIPVRLPAL